MALSKIFKRSKIDEENAHYNEDNIIKAKSTTISSKGINVKTGMRIVNFIGAIVTLAIVCALVYGAYFVFTNFVDITPIIGNPQETQTISIEETDMASESLPA